MGSKGVEGEALSSPKEARASLPTWKAEKPTARARLKGVANWIAEHELWLLAVVVPVLIFPELVPERLITLVLLLIPIPWLCRRIATGHLIRRTPLNFSVFVLLMMIPVSLYASTDFSLSLVTVYQIVAGVALFYGLVNTLSSEQAMRRMMALLVAVGAGLALIAPVTAQWISKKVFILPQFFQRIPLLIGDPITRNVLAGLLVMLIPLPLSLVLFSVRGEPVNRSLTTRFLEAKPLLALVLIPMLLMLVLTQSRGAYIAFVTTAIILGIARNRWMWLAVPIGVLSLVIGVQTFGIEAISDPLLVQDATYGLQARQEIWQRAIYMLQDFPYTGIGLRTFPRVVNVMYPFFSAGPNVEILHAHNLFLQVGVDMGMPGLVAFVALLFDGMVLAWLAFRRLDRGAQSDLKALALALLCSFVAMAVHGLLDSIWGSKITVIFWLMLGLSVALYHLSQPSGEASGWARRAEVNHFGQERDSVR